MKREKNFQEKEIDEKDTKKKDENKRFLHEFVKWAFIIIWIKILIIIFFFFHAAVKKTNFKIQQPEFCFQESCFELEIADTPEKRTLGYMFRKQIPDNQAMLFVFWIPGYHSFWMKNTLVPLDMIWLDEDYRVISINQAEPCWENEDCPWYSPDSEIKISYVIEANSWTAEKIWLSIWDIVEIKNYEYK